MTADEQLAIATKDFESTFENVRLAASGRTFKHHGKVYDHIVICGGPPKDEGDMSEVFDRAELAIEAWRDAVRPYEGKKYLYWRILPEIEQDTNEFSWVTATKEPNPTYGKWRVYSRFRSIDE